MLEDEQIVLFYDGVRSHITFNVIEKHFAAKISAMELPAHTSDRLKPLEVSVFSPFKDFAAKALENMEVL